MIEEPGQVVQAGGGYAWVETRPRTACDSCGSSDGCGTGALSKAFGRRNNRIRVIDTVGCTPGDRVILGLDEAALLRSSLVLYAVPLIMMILAALVGRTVLGPWLQSDPETVAMVSGVLGLVFGFAWARRFGRRAAGDSRYQPVILRHQPGGTAVVRHADAPGITH